MEKEFVNYNQALNLKALGFDEPCFGWYENNELVTLLDCTSPEDIIEFIKVEEISKRISAPTFSQAFRWFRVNHGLDSFCRQTTLTGRSYYKISRIATDEIIKGYSNFTSSYEEAELACLEKLIEIVESKSQ